MKKISTVIALLAITATLPQAALAQTADDVVITVDRSTGSLYRAGEVSTAWSSQWKSTATTPGVIVSTSVNNMQWSGNYIDMRPGSAGSCIYTIQAVDKEWYVSAYEFTFKNINSGSNTFTSGSKSMTSSTTEQVWSVDGISETDDVPTFTMAGDNSCGQLITDFRVTLSHRTFEVPKAFIPTTITEGEFAPETNWYTMQVGAPELVLSDPGLATSIALTRNQTNLSDEDLWCFVGDEDEGFRIYNKAAGTDKSLASPSSPGNGTTYPILRADGLQGYTYEWQLTKASDLDVPAYYINLKGNTKAVLNNFGGNGKLSFWTQGTDAGSCIQLLWAKQTFDVTEDAVTMANVGNTSLWYGIWTRKAEPRVSLSTVKNNMQWNSGKLCMASGIEYGPWKFGCETGYLVTAYEFDAVLSAGVAANVLSIGLPSGESVAVNSTTEPVHISVSDLTADDDNSFTIDAVPANANKSILASNFKVTVSREIAKLDRTIVFRYSGEEGYNICYRIPAITTVENGPAKGRLIAINDYRYSGGDIGAGRIDLYKSVSDDNGLTWSTPGHLYNAAGQPVAEGDYTYNADCAFGDACIVSDRESGRVLMMAVGGHVGFFASRRATPNQCFRWYSDDGGDTWTDADNITEQILSLFDGEPTYGKIDGQFFGSGRICQSRQVKVGDYYRLYAVLSSQNGGGNTRNWCLYSDDFGKTWTILGGAPCVASVADEPKAEELPDGSVLLAARRNGGNRNFNIFRYTDVANGRGEWGTVNSTDMGQGSINACDGEIMIVPVRNVATGNRCYMALQSFPYGGTRKNVSIVWKPIEQGADFAAPTAFSTWNGRFQVTSKGSAYSTMAWQHDNTLGFLYEEDLFGKSYCGVYRNLTIEEITDGAYEYCPDEDEAVRIALTNSLLAYRLETEAAAGEPGQYVGQPTGEGNVAAETAAADYADDPTFDNVVAFNNAIIDGQATIGVIHGGIYTIMSANNGHYPSMPDQYLSCDGTNLVSVKGNTAEATRFILLQKAEDPKGWLLYNQATARYVAQSPSLTETLVAMTDRAEEAHEYVITADINGAAVIADAEPGLTAYPALHLATDGRIVAWSATSTASKWYVGFEAMADVLPNFDPTAVGITGADAEPGNVEYYDVTGRRVANPVKGSLYITDDHRKVVY